MPKARECISFLTESCLIEFSSQNCTRIRQVFRKIVSVYFLHIEHLAYNNEVTSYFQCYTMA